MFGKVIYVYTTVCSYIERTLILYLLLYDFAGTPKLSQLYLFRGLPHMQANDGQCSKQRSESKRVQTAKRVVSAKIYTSSFHVSIRYT